MMDIYLKLRDPDEIDSSSREHKRFVGTLINFLAGPRRALTLPSGIGVSILQAGSTGDSLACRGSENTRGLAAARVA